MAFSGHRRLFNGRGAMARFVFKEKYKGDYPGSNSLSGEPVVKITPSQTDVGTQATIYTS